jgi:hypothetical protein
MTSVLQSRKAAGAGNYFLVLDTTDDGDSSGVHYVSAAPTARVASLASTDGQFAEGTVLRDLGKRVVITDTVAANAAGNATLQEWALVQVVGGNVGQADQTGYVVVRDTAASGALAVKVAAIGAATRN